MFRIYICIIANHFMNLTQKILIDFINFCSRSLVQRTWVEIHWLLYGYMPIMSFSCTENMG